MSEQNPVPDKAPYHPPAFTLGPNLALYDVPLASYLPSNLCASGIPYQGIATGSVVIDPRTTKVLLVQRAPHDSMPLRWETPGGAVDPEDESIIHGAVRELYEEAGLVATRVCEVVGGVRVFFTRRGQLMGRINFLVEVDVPHDGDIDVKLDPNEHVQYVWASEEEARAKRVDEVVFEYTNKAQEQTIYEAFRIWRERASGTSETL
ncbi:hypothetical protein TruAng_003669 [Truncatella angustata]|nr:hypothetical protein TruAng_003669 [Truncatella angustata]